MADNEIADILETLAANELSQAHEWANGMRAPHQTIMLIEACRLIDLYHVMQFISTNRDQKRIPEFEFDLMMRGWNLYLGLLLPHVRDMGGVPLVESTSDSRGLAFNVLITLGRASLCRETARRIRHGMITGTISNGTISLRMAERCSSDHFLDRLDHDNLSRLEKKLFGKDNRYSDLIKAAEIKDLEARLDSLVFPWKPNPHNTMVGYGMEPDIDEYYLSLVTQGAIQGRDDAGIHPESNLGGVSGGDLSLIVLLTMSTYLKHMRLVDRGKRKFPEVNYAMSLTIWKPRHELIETLSDYLHVPTEMVARAIELITVRSGDHAFFTSEPTTFVPMLIEISKDHLLAPVSSIFRNPFHELRMLHEFRHPHDLAAISRPRENWMKTDLYHLFLGNRYRLMDTATRLSRSGQIVTDIDAAILDILTGEIALFQLKWQDFNSNDVRKQSSRAKNFVEKVDAWADRTEEWVAEFGVKQLLQALRLSAPRDMPAPSIRLFALRRSASRFRSYGHVPKNLSIAACSWHQFIRIRHDVGPSDHVVTDLHMAIQAEQTRTVTFSPIRQEMSMGSRTIVFEDIWRSYDDGSKEEDSSIVQP